MPSAKKLVEQVLKKHPPLFAMASKLYYSVNSSFQTLSPGAPDAIYQALKIANDIGPASGGDYYEFGLFRGYTLWAAYEACKTLGLPHTHLYGFDSFEGLPAVEGIDRGNAGFFASQFACSKATVVDNLTRRGVDWSRISLIAGYFDKALTPELRSEHPFQRVAVGFIDCDLYSSTQDVLAWLSSLVTEGSILLFDDWYSFGHSPALGQQRAFAEFLARNPTLVAEPLMEFEDHGKGFILRAAQGRTRLQDAS